MNHGMSGDESTPGTSPAPEKKTPVLKSTGERFIPGTANLAEVTYDHLTRYRLVERYVGGKSVIDMGCGAGYGSHSLAGMARSVVGVDLSEEAISYAAGLYSASNLRYGVGDVSDLPYEEGSFERAVSFEVIEHLENPEELVVEAKRLLEEGGIFVVSTPDKQTYSNERNRVNPYHLKEMYPLEFRELLERHFQHVQIYWQGALAGSLITPDPESLPEDGKVEPESAQFSLPDPGFGSEMPATLFMVAVCTDGDFPAPLERPLMILDRDRQIYEEYDDLQHVPAQLRRQHNHEAQELKQQNARRQRLINQLRDQNEKRRGRLNELEQQNKGRQRRINQLRDQNEKLQKENTKLNQLSRERELMINSRGWKIANRINIFSRKVRSILGRRTG